MNAAAKRTMPVGLGIRVLARTLAGPHAAPARAPVSLGR